MVNWVQGKPLGRKFQALVTHDGVFIGDNMIATEELWFPQHEVCLLSSDCNQLGSRRKRREDADSVILVQRHNLERARELPTLGPIRARTDPQLRDTASGHPQQSGLSAARDGGRWAIQRPPGTGSA